MRSGEAVDERLGRPVAVKILHPWAAADADARGRFRREAAAMARLDHPNVVAVLDYGEDEQAWLVQALCTGGTLSAVLPSAPLPWPRVVALALPIARALAHAHSQGVIHRDLKPSNVLFGADGHVLVGDFGLARLVASAETTITATGTRLGSPEYWSPEQAAGEPVSEKTDLYALGCLLYQLATGALPFPPGEDRLAAGFRRIHEDPLPARAVEPGVPPAAEALLQRLLARSPSARPRAADLVAELEGRAPAPARPEAASRHGRHRGAAGARVDGAASRRLDDDGRARRAAPRIQRHDGARLARADRPRARRRRDRGGLGRPAGRPARRHRHRRSPHAGRRAGRPRHPPRRRARDLRARRPRRLERARGRPRAPRPRPVR